MNNIVVWIVGAVILVGGGFFLFANSGTNSQDVVAQEADTAKEMMKEKGDDSMMEKKTEDTAMKKDDTMEGSPTGGSDAIMKKDGGAMMSSGSYEVYAPDKLVKANSGKVVLFFRAVWCPTCKALDADIRAHLSDIPKDFTILDVDYDSSAALKQKYGVTYQHTFVQVKADGALIKKWSGSPTLAALVSEVQ